MIDEIEDEILLEELRTEKAEFKSILNKKKLSKWEMDNAFMGEM